MTAGELAAALRLTPFAVSDETRPVTGGYAGDLLSWVMGRAEADCAWVTIMSNVNVVAVASLADVSLAVLAEGVKPDEGVAERAKAQGVNLYGSEKATFALCAEIAALL